MWQNLHQGAEMAGNQGAVPLQVAAPQHTITSPPMGGERNAEKTHGEREMRFLKSNDIDVYVYEHAKI